MDRLDVAQQLAKDLAEQDEAAVFDLDEIGLDRDAALAELHREPDDDQPAWREAS